MDDYTSPILPPRKLTYPNNRSDFDKRHASLHIEPNENYQRMRNSLQNDSVRAVYHNRLQIEDIVNTGEPTILKKGSVTLTPNLQNKEGANQFSGIQANKVKPSRSGQLGNILEAGKDQELLPIAISD